MSRGIKVLYAETSSALPASGAGQQLGDYCVVKSDVNTDMPRILDPSTVEGFSSGDIYQSRTFRWDGAAWNETTNFVYTDDSIVPNVTKVRKAHFDDIRNIIKSIQDNKLNKYGDKYYNTHNYTNAVMYWGLDSDLARIYMGDYGADAKYLTVEFGDNRGAYSGDRVRFMYRSGVVNDIIMDILGDQVHILKYLLIDANFRVNGESVFNGNVNITGSLDIDTNLNVDGNSVLAGTLLVDGAVTLNNNLYVAGTTTLHSDVTAEANVQVNGFIHANQYIATDTQLVSNIATGTPPLVVASSTVVENLNAHLLDGVHRGDGPHLVSTNNGVLQGEGNDVDPRYGIDKHMTGTGLNAHMVDGYHIEDIVQRIATITNDGTAYYDSGASLDGYSIKVKIEGTNYYVPASSSASGVCHSSCHSSCHGSCHCFRMCHMYIDEDFQKERE